MKLVSFSVSKYRSIIRAHKLPISPLTILIGQNNEGKSNLLAALSVAMDVVQQLGRVRIVNGRVRGATFRRRGGYSWQRDFPLQLQDTEPNGESVFRLEFQLSGEERDDLRARVGSNVSSLLPIEVRLGDKEPFFKVIKQGPSSVRLNKNRTEIAKFIGERIEFTYIPAVRTAQAALEVVRDMVEQALLGLQEEATYRDAVERVAELQKPVLEDLSIRIGDALKEFLPSVTAVRVQVDEDNRYRALRRAVDVIVDDGIATSLERKGDGVQSLAAISLLRRTNTDRRQLVLALEEPESHLHPSAIHRLRGVIRELADTHQVVLTTHCPVFADRMNIGANILVQSNKAKPAKRIEEIRETLGVRASDNLRHAQLVLVVEGTTDERVLKALLVEESDVLATALQDHALVIDALRGGAKLSYKLSELRNAIVEYHCFLDNDETGRKAVETAIGDGLLGEHEYHVIAPQGGRDAELEDLIVQSIYKDKIEREFGIVLSGPTWRTRGKWSDRLRNTMIGQGKVWRDEKERRAKEIVCEAVVNNPAVALHGSRRGPVDALIVSLERRLQGA